MVRLAINLQKMAGYVSVAIPLILVAFILLGVYINVWFHIGTAIFGLLTLLNFYYKHMQTSHTVLRNFGLLGSMRYTLESIGPELRQYFYMNDNEERPFTRTERAEVYRKAKNVDSSESFGSLKEFDDTEIKLRHSFFPILNKEVKPYSCTFGEERGCKSKYTITKPFMISAMSYGSLGKKAVRSLARGAGMAGIAMNTGEGGYPKYHLMEDADIIFQMGTAKFGVRHGDGSLDEEKLQKLANHPKIKMIEIKLSQGAKPGKGGLLPKEKVTKEIARLRHVPFGKDVVSPERHVECDNLENTIKFIKHVQDVSKLPVGIKFCLGCPDEFRVLVKELKKQKIFPDYIAVDGSEGGTGAAPKSFMDGVGLPIYVALDHVNKILIEERVRDKLKLIAAGKMLNTRKQMVAFAHGADAVYIARGFMFSLGCIQAMQCNKDTCPVGITTHNKTLQRGLVIADKAQRVANYANNMDHEFKELLASMGVCSIDDLSLSHIYEPKKDATASCHV